MRLASWSIDNEYLYPWLLIKVGSEPGIFYYHLGCFHGFLLNLLWLVLMNLEISQMKLFEILQDFSRLLGIKQYSLKDF